MRPFFCFIAIYWSRVLGTWKIGMEGHRIVLGMSNSLVLMEKHGGW